MTDNTFVSFLNERRPEVEKILVALRFYLAEVTNDKLPRELQEELTAGATDPKAVETVLVQLRNDRDAQARCAIMLFADRWSDPAERERITRAFDATGTKLPVVEAGIIAIVGMYGMFLIATGGRQQVIRTIERRPDGSYVERTEEKMYGPMGPIKAVLALFGVSLGKKD